MVRPSSYRRVWLAWSLGICLFGTTASAAESNPRAEQRVASIIDRLSGPSFQDRLNAEDEALQNGDTVLPALQQVQDSQDPELRLRARQLIQRIEQDGLQQSLRAFLAPNSTSELPGWSLVGEIVGDTPENRKYYADLLQAEPQLTQALRRQDRLAGELARRQQEFGNAMFGGLSSPQSPMRSAALMILLLHPDLNAPDQVRGEASRLVLYGIATGGSTVGDRFVESLAVQWVVMPRPGTAHQRFELGWRLNRPEVVVPALELIRQRPIPNQASGYFAMLARYGGPEEIDALESLLDDVSEQWSHERDDTKMQTQVRDLALAALIELTQQKAEEYGLKPFDRDVNRRIRALRPVFENEAAREAALAKWKTWSALNLKKYWGFPSVAVEGTTL